MYYFCSWLLFGENAYTIANDILISDVISFFSKLCSLEININCVKLYSNRSKNLLVSEFVILCSALRSKHFIQSLSCWGKNASCLYGYFVGVCVRSIRLHVYICGELLPNYHRGASSQGTLNVTENKPLDILLASGAPFPLTIMDPCTAC